MEAMRLNVVERNEDVSQGEVLHQKKHQIREEVRHIRLQEIRMQHNKLWAIISDLTDRFGRPSR